MPPLQHWRNLVETEIVFTIIRESVSLGVLIIVLVGGYRLLNKAIDLVDIHLGRLENDLAKIVVILEENINA
jgi:hypothetical protein